MNQLLKCAYEYATEREIGSWSFRKIICLMVTENKIPLSLGRKISQKDNDLWIAYVYNKEEKSILSIEDAIEREHNKDN